MDLAYALQVAAWAIAWGSLGLVGRTLLAERDARRHRTEHDRH